MVSAADLTGKAVLFEQLNTCDASPAVTLRCSQGRLYGEITANVQVRLDNGRDVYNSLAGLVLRRPDGTGNSPAYFVALRNISSSYYCGIYEWTGSARVNRTPGLTTCKYDLSVPHTLEARVISGRVEMYMDGAFQAAWADPTPAPAAGVAVQTIDGPASFDNLRVYGATSRSAGARSAPLRLFGAARGAERSGARDDAGQDRERRRPVRAARGSLLAALGAGSGQREPGDGRLGLHRDGLAGAVLPVRRGARRGGERVADGFQLCDWKTRHR